MKSNEFHQFRYPELNYHVPPPWTSSPSSKGVDGAYEGKRALNLAKSSPHPAFLEEYRVRRAFFKAQNSPQLVKKHTPTALGVATHERWGKVVCYFVGLRGVLGTPQIP